MKGLTFMSRWRTRCRCMNWMPSQIWRMKMAQARSVNMKSSSITRSNSSPPSILHIEIFPFDNNFATISTSARNPSCIVHAVNAYHLLFYGSYGSLRISKTKRANMHYPLLYNIWIWMLYNNTTRVREWAGVVPGPQLHNKRGRVKTQLHTAMQGFSLHEFL